MVYNCDYHHWVPHSHTMIWHSGTYQGTEETDIRQSFQRYKVHGGEERHVSKAHNYQQSYHKRDKVCLQYLLV